MRHIEYFVNCKSPKENLEFKSNHLTYSEVEERIKRFSRGRLLSDGDRIEISIMRKWVLDLEEESESI